MTLQKKQRYSRLLARAVQNFRRNFWLYHGILPRHPVVSFGPIWINGVLVEYGKSDA